jgi:hypothetical protein
MDKKYYTPSIEEFHIGFEYEWSEEGRKIWIEEQADQDDVSLAYSSYEETPDIYPDEYRVKYLDREDIESLGFVYNEEYIYYTPTRNFQLNHKETHQYNLRVIDEQHGEVIFIGYIKNKSELRRLLKQLKII